MLKFQVIMSCRILFRLQDANDIEEWFTRIRETHFMLKFQVIMPGPILFRL